MDPTVTGALIGAGGTVIVALAGIWANVRNTSVTSATSRSAVEAAQRTVELTQRNVELTEQGQVTNRYTKAIEQLGSDKFEVRIGGIYALERVARDSARDHPTVMEVLSQFIREHSRKLPVPSADDEPGVDAPKHRTRPDVQAAVTVIGRRNPAYDPEDLEIELPGGGLLHQSYGPDLTGADLTRADLTRADLAGARLARADLTGADLAGADLSDAFLADANFTGAYLTGAVLSWAYLAHANLTDADLTDVVLTNANLSGTDLTSAKLGNTNLAHANLTDVDLTEVDLDAVNLADANFTNAAWPPKALAPPGWQRDADSARLKRAETNSDGAATD